MYKCNAQVVKVRSDISRLVGTQCSFTRWNIKSWKYDAQHSIFDELQCISSGDEMLNAWYYFSKKWFKKMQKWAVFHLISKHAVK